MYNVGLFINFLDLKGSASLAISNANTCTSFSFFYNFVFLHSDICNYFKQIKLLLRIDTGDQRPLC